MTMARLSFSQEYPDDDHIDVFPISPDVSMAGLSLEPGSRCTTPLSSTFPEDIPMMLYDDAYTRDSFVFGPPAPENDVSMTVPTSEVSNRHSQTPHLKRLTAHQDRQRPLDCLQTLLPEDTTNGKQHRLSQVSLVNSLLPAPEVTGPVEDWYGPRHRTSAASVPRDSTIVEPALSSFGETTPSGSCSTLSVRSSDDTSSRQSSKTASWISSNDWDYQQYQDFVAQQKKKPGRTSSQRKSLQPGISNTSHTAEGIRRVSRPTPLVCSPTAVRFQHATTSLNSPRDDVNIPWLKTLVVHFLVDQEGFRDAKPTFKFLGISQVRRYDQSSSSESTKLLAQFRPTTRQAFNFHYAPFDGPPILRRITLNSDESVDYVTRQAHLSLRSNGVFVVQGHELAPADQGSEPSKLYWQFEYLVDDRRMDESRQRRSLEGEKTLTPLTFACSPNLLSPRQGKKINIMHIFKKSVAQKLVAEKMQPPGGYPISPNQEHFATRGMQVQSLHRRTRSHGVGNEEQQPRAVSDHIYPGHSQEAVDIVTRHARHRRVSSADQHPKAPNPELNTASPKPSRHIVPPAQLSCLLDSPSKENILPPSPTDYTPRPMSARSSRGFIALSPRPKHLIKQGTL